MAAELTARPSLFPLDFDEAGRRLYCVPLMEADFRAASFLDERILAEGRAGSWVPFEEVADVSAHLAGESDYIFHIGHAGSTLVSRLLGASERVFALREPAILRTLARRLDRATDRAHRGYPLEGPHLGVTLKLLARVWRPGQRSLVKATSFVSDIAPAILAASPRAKALLMFVSPQVHIATRLAGPATRAELPAVSEQWLERLHRRLGGVYWRLERISEGERAALGWACEICALASAAHSFPGRVRWLEFEAFLADPAAGLAAVATFLHGDLQDGDVASMLAQGDLGRYSKAPQFNYDARTRSQTIESGLRDHADEIGRGIAWLNAAGNAHPLIAEAARSSALAVRSR